MKPKGNSFEENVLKEITLDQLYSTLVELELYLEGKEKQSLVKYLKRAETAFSLIISSVFSILINIDFTFDVNKFSPSKYSLISQTLFNLLVFVENLILILLPHDDNISLEFRRMSIIVVVILGIIGNLLQVINFVFTLY